VETSSSRLALSPVPTTVSMFELERTRQMRLKKSSAASCWSSSRSRDDSMFELELEMVGCRISMIL
jgi:hypothetical protein